MTTSTIKRNMMRFRDIKVGMTVQVKSNAAKLTPIGSTCFEPEYEADLRELQNSIGTVILISYSDNTIQVEIGKEKWWFDTIHLTSYENVPITSQVDVTKVVPIKKSRKAELEDIINNAIAAERVARKELEELNATFTVDEMFAKRENGVYSVNGADDVYCIVIGGCSPLYYNMACVESTEILNKDAWKGSKFTLTDKTFSIQVE